MELRPTLDPRPTATVTDLRTRRSIDPASERAFANHQIQRATAQLDRLAEYCVEADNVLLAVAADLARLYEGADDIDAESCLVRRAIIRRAGAAILRFRRPEALASAQTGGAR